MVEIYKTIDGFDSYEVSNLGNVRNKKTGKILNPSKINSGYLSISLGRNKKFLVHRLVAETFIPNPENKPCVNHLDCDKTNNVAFNLSWCTYSENNNYADHGLLQSISHIKNLDNNKRAKKVYQYDLDGNFIKMYLSTREAERQTGANHADIGKCCRGKLKTCKNFKWKYKNE